MFQSCPAKYFLRAKMGYVARRKSAALGFGGAIHAGLAEWYKSHDPKRALLAIDSVWPNNLPIDDWRTKQKCLQTMAEYIRNYPTEVFDIIGYGTDAVMIECTFTLPTGMYLDCASCGEPAWCLGDEKNESRIELDSPFLGLCRSCGESCELIEYGGIFDGLVEYGGIYVLEHKSTSVLGSYYFNQFKPNNQVTGYIWAAGKLSGQKVGGALVNAIGVYKAGATKFERQITNRSEAEIQAWLINLRNSCQMIADCERRGFWPQHTGSCTIYGKCEYHDVHVLSTEKEQQKRLESDYVIEHWAYEDRDDTVT